MMAAPGGLRGSPAKSNSSDGPMLPVGSSAGSGCTGILGWAAGATGGAPAGTAGTSAPPPAGGLTSGWTGTSNGGILFALNGTFSSGCLGTAPAGFGAAGAAGFGIAASISFSIWALMSGPAPNSWITLRQSSADNEVEYERILLAINSPPDPFGKFGVSTSLVAAYIASNADKFTLWSSSRVPVSRSIVPRPPNSGPGILVTPCLSNTLSSLSSFWSSNRSMFPYAAARKSEFVL